jgi:hypothetical protein
VLELEPASSSPVDELLDEPLDVVASLELLDVVAGELVLELLDVVAGELVLELLDVVAGELVLELLDELPDVAASPVPSVGMPHPSVSPAMASSSSTSKPPAASPARNAVAHCSGSGIRNPSSAARPLRCLR